MVNLLPKKTQATLVRRYYLRFVTTLMLVLGIVFFVGAVLLIPSYFSAQANADAYERYRDALEGSVGLKEREYVSGSIAELAERIRIMEAYGDSAFTVEMLNALDDVIEDEISITGIAMNRTDEGALLSLNGIADTRETLLAFVELLKEHAAFSQVTLPVSQLVFEEDIDFSLQIVFTKQQP